MKSKSYFNTVMCMLMFWVAIIAPPFVSSQIIPGSTSNFITHWNSANSSPNNEIVIPTNGAGYDYDVYWEDLTDPTVNGQFSNVTGNLTITFPAPGNYKVEIFGDFPWFFGNGYTHRNALLSVEQWGDIQWQNFNNAFRNFTNLKINATDAPNLSQVTDMSRMFMLCTALDNENLNSWNTSNVTNMLELFRQATNFNGAIDAWDVSNVTNMQDMFRQASAFNGAIGSWNTQNVTNMVRTFRQATAFNQPLNNWNVGNVTSMLEMFHLATNFNQNLDNWNTSSVTTMREMFQQASAFNGSIDTWDVSNVTNMQDMFRQATAFNQPLNGWNVSSVTTMLRTFFGATAFNQSINNWNTSSLTSAANMFQGATSYNQSMNNWNTATITNMSSMFQGATAFNGDISAWNVANTTNMSSMFQGATSFNQNIGNWAVNNVSNMGSMFRDASAFNQNLGAWNLRSNVTLTAIFQNAGLDCENYSLTLIGWEANPNTPVNRNMGNVSGMTFSPAGQLARQLLVLNHNWTIQNQDSLGTCATPFPFVTIWKSDNAGITASNQIEIPTTGTGYNYNVEWEDVNNQSITGVLNNQTGNATITFPSAGTYRVKISGDFPRIFFNNAGDRLKLISIDQWGEIAWESFEGAFYGCENMTMKPNIDNPNILAVTSFQSAFRDAKLFNGVIGGWNVGGINNMASAFEGAESFDRPLNTWNVSNVTNTSAMFKNAINFNRDLAAWNTANITNMSEMFSGAIVFNQDIGGWNITQVNNMTGMLDNCGLITLNYDLILEGWEAQNVQNNVALGAAGLTYCASQAQRQSLITNSNWTITGDALDCQLVQTPFITHWNSANSSPNNEIVIPTNGAGYDYDVYWEDLTDPTVNGQFFNVTGNLTITFPAPGNYKVEIFGDFPWFFGNGYAHRNALLSVEQWGDIQWQNFNNAFRNFTNLKINATDAPNLSQVTDMSRMFMLCTALDNENLNSWNTSNVTNMLELFRQATNFNGAIDAWDVSNVTNMQDMFRQASAFNGAIGSWNTQNVTNMVRTFRQATAFNQPLNNWNVGNVTSMLEMFHLATNFNQNLDNWNTSSVTTMREMFQQASAFNGSIDTWDVSNVTNMQDMFRQAAAFNQPLNSWNVSSVTTMLRTFFGATAFNQSINNWNTSSLTSAANMFQGATSYNQSMNNWNTATITNMSSMFQGATAFNGDISAWNVANTTNMSSMFQGATSFNQNIGNWAVNNVSNMGSMFRDASAFNQDLGAWNLRSNVTLTAIFQNAGLDCDNYSLTLIGWEANPNTPVNRNMGNVSGMQYNAAGEIARTSLVTTYNWTIGAQDSLCTGVTPPPPPPPSNDFVTIWKSDNPGIGSSVQIQIPTFGTGYNFDLHWEDVNNSSINGSLIGLTGTTMVTFPTQGTYKVNITGDFPRIYFNNSGDRLKILSVENWGNIMWTSFEGAFHGCQNLEINAQDVPNLSGVTNFARIFSGASALTASLNNWNTSTVTNFSNSFNGCSNFNGNITDWNTGSAVNMESMFTNATQFNGDLSNWNVSNVTNMNAMFQNASSFDRSLAAWNVANVSSMTAMLSSSGLAACTYAQTLQGWSNLTLQNDVTLGASGLSYTSIGEAPRQSIINNFNWTINDNGQSATNPLSINGNINGMDITTNVTGNTGTVNFSWSGPNGFTASTPNITAPTSGTYTLVITDDCHTTSQDFGINNASISEGELGAGFNIFPNPAADVLNVVWNDNFNHSDVLTIQNALGATIWTSEVNQNSTMTISLNDWNNGVYFIRLGNQTKRFIIAR
jgi:surface protein